MSFEITQRKIDLIVGIAKAAGDKIIEIYNSDFKVDTKSDSSPVTDADRVADALIVGEIKATITDAFPIVSEEAFSPDDPTDVSGGTFWLVDPLDGTKEFISRNGDFTVNIALIENSLPIFGVVHLPALDSTYWGSKLGSFAKTWDGDGNTRRIECRPIPDDGMVALVSRSHRSNHIDDYLRQFTIKDEISAGSSLKFCRVAEGAADIYPRLGRTMEWDIAAGHAVVRFAGGVVADLEGNEISYGKPGFENPPFVAAGTFQSEIMSSKKVT